jgi:hypothetical protein
MTDCLFEVLCSLRLRVDMPIGRCVVHSHSLATL